MKSSVGVNPQGRSTEKLKLLQNDSHFEPQVVMIWSSENPNAKRKTPLPDALNVEVVL
jgi:hypothetical protein